MDSDTKKLLYIFGGVIGAIWLINKISTMGVTQLRKEFDMPAKTTYRTTQFDTKDGI